MKVLSGESDLKAGARNRERAERAMQLLEEAIALDPEYPWRVFYCYPLTTSLWSFLARADRPKSLCSEPSSWGKRPSLWMTQFTPVHANLAFSYMYTSGSSIKPSQRRKKPYPSAPIRRVSLLGLRMGAAGFSGRPQEGIPMLQKSLRLSPIPVHSQVLGMLASILWDA